MNEHDLKRFKDNYTYEEEALDLVEELHDKYGEIFLCIHLESYDKLHTVEIMEKIKKEMEDKFIISICATNQTIEEELEIDRIFPNLYLLLDYDRIIEMMIKKEWIDEHAIMKPKSNDRYISRERTLYTKGANWDKCPISIQKHFLKIKKIALNKS